MGLESATYISGLIPTNPVGGDQRSQGDDHVRLIKSVLQNTFPNINGAVTVTQTELNSLAGFTGLVTDLIAQINGIIPSGTKMLFYQASPPVGWTGIAINSTNDYMLRVVPPGGGGSYGGTNNPILMDIVPSHTHQIIGNTGGQSADHVHGQFAMADYQSGGPNVQAGTYDHVVGSYGTNTGGTSNDHTHGINFTSQINGGAQNWAPRYANVCIGQKT